MALTRQQRDSLEAIEKIVLQTETDDGYIRTVDELAQLLTDDCRPVLLGYWTTGEFFEAVANRYFHVAKQACKKSNRTLNELTDECQKIREAVSQGDDYDRPKHTLFPYDSLPPLALIAMGDRELFLSATTVNKILKHVGQLASGDVPEIEWLSPVLKQAADWCRRHEISTSLRKTLEQLMEVWPEDSVGQWRIYRYRISREVTSSGALPLLPGEPWVAEAERHVAASNQTTEWVQFVDHCRSASTGKPSKKWLSAAVDLIQRLGTDEIETALPAWFAAVEQPRTDEPKRRWFGASWPMKIVGPNADALKGLVWSCSLSTNGTLARSLGRLASAAYQKVPGVGPRLQKVGNAAVWALGQMESHAALAQLAYLKVRVKFGTAQKLIAKALAEKAKQLGVPEDEVEEMGVPAYGLTDIGLREEVIGEYTARMTVDAKGKSIIQWIKKDGKIQKSVPAAIKVEFAADIKELKAAGKDLAKMLPAQRDRLDNLFLRTKPWDAEKWRERYLDHPVVGILARKLIWNLATGEDVTPVCWTDGQLADVAGQPVALADATTVSLWHPLDGTTDDVLAWRERLEELEVTQPFKQAHREVYVLTDAERNTGTYSNRFAAHILKQHQFNALAQARGWKSATRMMVDDAYLPPMKKLPEHDLRVEFWVEGVGDDWDEQYVLDSGSFRYVATDQVRFYEHNAAENYAHASGGAYDTYGEDDASNQPLPLDQIDRKVFSETLRDVDLFVGVASVGNDPNWNDGGLEGHFRDYWHDFSFGELSASANTRKAVLERLVPRLKIADRCSFSDRFLIVRGDVRTYHIHLGSGNIQMEPNNEYLCIVPNASINRKGDAVTLPFEGDRTLSIILSKALLLAEDMKIKDSTILSQIGR